MPERIEIAVFTISGRAEIENGEIPAKEVVRTLNNRSKALASNIEAEVRRSIPPHPLIMIQAEVRFYEGSLLMAATVTLLSWTGSIILDAVRDELSQVIRIAVQRVMSDLNNELPPPPVVGAMEITATAVPEIGRPRRPPLTTVGQDLKRSPALTVTVLILLILVLLLLADRFFVISVRDTAPVASVTSQSVSPQTK